MIVIVTDENARRWALRRYREARLQQHVLYLLRHPRAFFINLLAVSALGRNNTMTRLKVPS